MKRILKKILHIIEGTTIVGLYFLLVPFAKVWYLFRPIWIITERPKEARDNGFVFFQYMRMNHKDIKCFYAIDFSCKDYDKIAPLGNLVKFGSIRHFFMFCGAKYVLSSTTQYFCPNYFLTLLRQKVHLFSRFIFLQHGITYNNQTMLYKKNMKLDLLICGALPEYEYTKKNFGYKESEIIYSGFARFDNYYNLLIKKQILVMPTWRRGLDKSNFVKSDYFKNWNAVLNSADLSNCLVKNGTKIIFYIHPLFQEFIGYFRSSYENILIKSAEDEDLTELIKNSQMLITDYSSVFFDFAYMNKPIIYFQFDYDKFYKIHYKKGYFSFQNDGFGPVCINPKDVIDKAILFLETGESNKHMYDKRSNSFFTIKDQENCKRIYTEIVTRW